MPRARLAALLALLGACVQHVVEPQPARPDTPPANAVWWAPELGLDSLEAVGRRLEQPFEDAFDVVALVDGQMRSAVAPNCSQALVLLGKGYQPMSDGDAAAFKLEVAKCQVVKALGTAKPAARGLLASFRLNADPLSVLPPALGPEPNPTDVEERAAATKAGKSWRVHDPEARITASDARHAKVDGGGWTTELELLARADFDADGRDDIMILALSYGADGSWRQVRLHQLSANEGHPIFQLVKQIPI